MSKKRNNKKKKNKPSIKKVDGSSLLSGLQIPHNIMGATFDPSLDDIETLDKMIAEGVHANGVNGTEEKLRVLFISEASYLHTGFGTYMNNVLKRLNKNPNISCFELGAYGQSPRREKKAAEIEWTYFHNMPDNDEENRAYQAEYKDNQFGKFKVDAVLEEVRPHVILMHRDWWMDKFVLETPAAKRAHIVWMACVDSYPQQWSWLDSYSEVDTVMSYSHFGKKVIEDQSRTELAKRHSIPEIDVPMVCQAGVDTDVYKPLDKAEVKASMGIHPGIKIIGTVMRNQPRKLFTRLIETYANFCVNDPKNAENTRLLLHTGIPDVGFDIPESIHRYGVNQRVLFSYKCKNCDHHGVSVWGFGNQSCPACGVPALATPSTANGLNDEQFNKVYNIMDLYVQASICEGDGMPATEAKACGVPIVCTDYSSLYEKNRNGGGVPLKVASMYTECETMQNRALFSRADLEKTFSRLLSKNGSLELSRLANAARKTAVDHYTWDLCAKKWEAVVLNAELKDPTLWDEQSLTGLIVTQAEEWNDGLDLSLNSLLPHASEIIVVTDSLNLDVPDHVRTVHSSDMNLALEEARAHANNDWALLLYGGEEFVPSGSDINKDINSNNGVARSMTLVTLAENSWGLDLNRTISSPRLLCRREVVGKESSLMLALSEDTANVINTHNQLVKNSNVEGLKSNYCNTALHLDQLTNSVCYIIRRRTDV